MKNFVCSLWALTALAALVIFTMLAPLSCAECPVLSNYVEKEYTSEGNNLIEVDLESDKQENLVFIYVDESRVDESRVFNLTETKNGRYFGHLTFDVTNTFVYKFYLSAPGYHSLLITTDGTYGIEDITGLCVNPECNKAAHKCNSTGNIIKRVKTTASVEHYGIDYTVQFVNGTVKIPYTMEPFNISLPDSNIFSSTNNSYDLKELKDPILISGIIYDKDANPAPGLTVGFYLHGSEPTLVHIFTKTGADGKFTIYYQPKGKVIYVVNLIIFTNESSQSAWTYNFRTKSAAVIIKKSKDLGIFIPAFPLVPTFIGAIVIGGLVILILTGQINIFSYKGHHTVKKEKEKE